MADVIKLTGLLSAPANMSAKISAPIGITAKLSAPINMTAKLSAPVSLSGRIELKGFPVYNSLNLTGFIVTYDADGNVALVTGGKP